MKHNPPDLIRTARLVLRRPKASDTANRYRYGSDPEVGKYMDWKILTSPGALEGAVERGQARWESGEEYGWIITASPDDEAIGNISCRIDGHSADFGYLLSRDVWGKGYATEAAAAVLQWLASLDEVARIWATCDIDNTASARILEKIGMIREGVMRKAAIRPNLAPGMPRDVLLYSWVRE